jgi:O-antigen ligase
MSRAGILLLAAILAAPVAAYLAYYLAKGLGFLDPPVSREQELKRSILAALYALLVLLPVFLFGWERRWPRVWIAFGVVCGAALVFFAVSGVSASRQLWRLRHQEPGSAERDPGSGAEGIELDPLPGPDPEP